MSVAVGGDTWSLAFAAAGTGAASAWTARQLSGGGCELTATVGGSYRLQRRATPAVGGFFELVETFTNLGAADVVLWFEVNITAAAEPPGCEQRQWNSHVTEKGSTCIDVGGRYNLSHSASFGWMKFYDGHGTGPVYNDPPFNPSVFVRGRRAGLGAVATDEWMRRHLRIHKNGSAGFFGAHNFGVPAHSAVKYTWAVFPTNSTDYYDFINLARAATVPAYTVHGPGAWIPYDFANGWPTAKLRTLLRALGTKTAILCGPLATGGAPWLGNDGYCNEQTFNLSDYLLQIGSACRRLKSLEPALSCIAPFETALSPCQLMPKPPDTAPPLPVFPDSVVITRAGAPAGYDFVYPHATPGTSTVQYIYAPYKGNTYGDFFSERVAQALAVGMDGMYMDFFDYAMSDDPARQFRHTYNLTLTGWDRRSVDAVEAAGDGGAPGPRAVGRRKVDLNWMTTPARVAAVDASLSSSPGEQTLLCLLPHQDTNRAVINSGDGALRREWQRCRRLRCHPHPPRGPFLGGLRGGWLHVDSALTGCTYELRLVRLAKMGSRTVFLRPFCCIRDYPFKIEQPLHRMIYGLTVHG
jgi:hypothetical protein